jgi:hypothetical protein
MVYQKGGREASPSWFRRQFLAATRAKNVKGRTWTIIKKCFDKNLLAVPFTNNVLLTFETHVD